MTTERSDSTSSARDKEERWAWVVLFAAFINLLIVSGFAFIVGMFQKLFLESFGESIGMTAWVTALPASLLQLGGPLSGLLSNRFSCRVTVMLGGILVAVGLVLSSFATSIFFLLPTFGIVTGCGIGLVYSPSVVIVNYYFREKRTLATGIALSAGGIGIIIFPFLCQFILDLYGEWRSTLLVFSGIMLHMCLMGALMFPKEAKDDLEVYFSGSQILIPETKPKAVDTLNIFKNHVFLIFCLELFLCNVGTGIYIVYYPSFAEATGTSAESIPYILAADGVLLTISRILLGAMAGSDNIDNLCVYIGLRIATSFVFGLAPFYATSFPLHALSMALCGTYSGGSYALITALTVQFVGFTNLSLAFGMQMFCAGAGFLVGPPLAALSFTRLSGTVC